MGMQPHHARMSTSIAVLWTAVLALQYVRAQQAPASGTTPVDPAESPVSSDGSSYQNSVIEIYPLQTSSFAQYGLPERVLFGNVTVRYVGQGLSSANSTFKSIVEKAFLELVPLSTDLSVSFSYRPGVGAPIIGPDGNNGSGTAYAPTPGMVAEFGGSRRLMQMQGAGSNSTLTLQHFENRFIDFQSIDVELLGYGTAASQILQITHPVQMNGFLTVLMAEQNINVQALPVNLSNSYAILPVVQHIKPALPTVYVLGTVLQIEGTGLFPFITQTQNMLLLSLSNVFGSQATFKYNRIHEVWSDEAAGIVRVSLITYTSQLMNSINDIAGEDVTALASQIAQASGQNLSATLVSSQPLGTMFDELSGAMQFNLDPSMGPPVNTGTSTQTSSKSSGLSGGAIAGIVIGAVAAVALAALLAATLIIRQRRKRLANAEGAAEKGAPILAPNKPLAKAFGPNASSGTGSSSAIAASKGSSIGEHSWSVDEGKPELHPLSDAWSISPSELAVCQLPDGKDWILGTGSFGQVYRGIKGGVQDVAIKQLIKPGNLHLRMFEKEVALLRHLNFDRNLVQFLGACVSDNNLMLVMELCEGGDLKDALGNDHKGNFGWHKHGAKVLTDIARGLHFLHTNHVIHRDLKTKNILLTRAGEAKIGDVGLAKLVGSQLLSTQLDTAGTFTYAAPELLLGEPCDQKADIYSFGVIMWEVVTHEIPVRGALRSIDVPKEAPAEVAGLIEACLRRSATARPTAKVIFDTLHLLLARPASKLPPLVESAESKVETGATENNSLATDSNLMSSQAHMAAVLTGETDATEGLMSTSSTLPMPPRLHSA